MYLFSNILGVFVFDSEFNVVDELHFKNSEELDNRQKFIEKIKSKHKALKEPESDELKNILSYFRSKKFLQEFYSKNLHITKEDVRNSVNCDNFIVQAIKSIDEIDKSINIIVKRLR